MAAEDGLSYDPVVLDAVEKRFWNELWDTAVDDAVVDLGIDMSWFGPVQAAIVSEEAGMPALNFILGAANAGAVEDGYLADAVHWVELQDVDYRVPLVPGLPGVAAAEEFFARHGHRRLEGPTKLIRNGSPPRRPPPGVEVLERTDPWEDEGFGDPLAESLGLPKWASTFFLDLPGRADWRCYCAIDGDEPLAYLAMLIDESVAEVALASRPVGERDGEGQDAVLHRCIADAAAAGCEAIVVGEAGGEPAVADRESLVRAGFESAFRCFTWQPRARVAM
jgi:hypothetical protein